MSRIAAVAFAVLAGVASLVAQEPQTIAPAPPLPPPFKDWLAEVRTEVVTGGIRPEIIEQAFTGVEPVEQILERDRAQAEFTLSLQSYLRRRLTRPLTKTAQQMYTQHRALLTKVGDH